MFKTQFAIDNFISKLSAADLKALILVYLKLTATKISQDNFVSEIFESTQVTVSALLMFEI